MKNDDFNEIIKNIISGLLKEKNVIINRFEEERDFYCNTFNISITCLDNEELIKK